MPPSHMLRTCSDVLANCVASSAGIHTAYTCTMRLLLYLLHLPLFHFCSPISNLLQTLLLLLQLLLTLLLHLLPPSLLLRVPFSSLCSTVVAVSVMSVMSVLSLLPPPPSPGLRLPLAGLLVRSELPVLLMLRILRLAGEVVDLVVLLWLPVAYGSSNARVASRL